MCVCVCVCVEAVVSRSGGGLDNIGRKPVDILNSYPIFFMTEITGGLVGWLAGDAVGQKPLKEEYLDPSSV